MAASAALGDEYVNDGSKVLPGSCGLPSDRDEVAFEIMPISAFGVRGRSLTVKMNNRR